MNEPEITFGGFIVSGSQPSRTFEFVEAAFNLVSQGIEEAINRDGLPAVRPARNDRNSTLAGDGFANMVRVIAAIGEEYFRWRQVSIRQQVKALIVGNFTSADLSLHGQTKTIGDQMYLGRETTF